MSEAARLRHCVDAAVQRLGKQPGPLLEILHQVQNELGCVPAEAVPLIADALNLSRAEVHGVISFYHHFRHQPAGRRVVQVCRAEACKARQGDALADALRRRFGVDFGQTTADGLVSLEAVYCLGNCACAPSIAVDGQVQGRCQAHLDLPGPAKEAVTTAAVPKGSVTVFVPGDSGAVSVGADAVARELEAQCRQRDIAVRVVRNGSRGMYWLEPLVEVQTPEGRVGYGPVLAGDVARLLDAGMLQGAVDDLRLGRVDEHPWMRSQQRLTGARLGIVDPADIADYLRHDGYQGLEAALGLTPAEIVRVVADSGLRGRGGAAFPTGTKWQTVLDQPDGQKYIACNADEGDSGTFADRMLMEGDPFSLIEGMTIAGIAVGATQGYVYLRVEYPHAARALAKALAQAREHGYLGPSVRGSRHAFDIEVRMGAGAYICGEETSMLESLQGRRGEVRVRPPLPAIRGLFDRPTVVNNVVTLATVPIILARGAAFYRDFGMGKSRGTVMLQLGGNVKNGGLVERGFGLTVRELVFRYGGGSATGRAVRTVQIGGPLGAYLPAADFDLPLDYEALAARDALLGHGGVVVFDDQVDMAHMARHALAFCAHESCGKCTPCRVGSTRGVELIDRLRSRSNGSRAADLVLLEELCHTMAEGSLCGLGGMTPIPVRSALRHFKEDFS